MTQVKRRNGWRMSCGVGEVTEERLENEQSSQLQSQQSSLSNLSVSSPTSQLILQPFRRFNNVTAHSPTLPLLHLRHSSFSNPSFASLTSQALHLIHLTGRPCNNKNPFYSKMICIYNFNFHTPLCFSVCGYNFRFIIEFSASEWTQECQFRYLGRLE